LAGRLSATFHWGVPTAMSPADETVESCVWKISISEPTWWATYSLPLIVS
jgi:hypothetical protein